MEKINLFGAGGHGRVIREIVEATGRTAGYYYDDAPRIGVQDGIPVLDAAQHEMEGPLIVCVGDNAARRRVAERLDAEFATAIHPSAIISPSSQIAEGTVVMAGAVVQAHAQIGRHCIINTGASVDHECEIGDFVHIAPHATLCGDIEVGEMTLIGAGSVVLSGVKIGKCCVIGAGSVVLHDIPDGSVVCGNPCHIHGK